MDRKPEKRMFTYVGYEDPQTDNEAELEILGLETLMATATHRMSILKQGKALRDILDRIDKHEKESKVKDESKNE